VASHLIRRSGFGAIAAVVAVAVSACGEGQQTKTVTVTTSTPATGVATGASHRKTRAAADGGARVRRHKSTLKACDPNIRVKADTTTCAFAENVFYEYWRSIEAGEARDIEAYSPALKTYLSVDCKQNGPVTCRTDAGALVRFPVRAVEAYTAEEAATYAASHTVSKGPHDTTAGATSGGDDSDCDPSYEGACLDPSAADYDCEGGSGDGPAYTGTVTVVGDDHFDLDRDGDGIACES
jgi:hypothetical protein